MKFKKGWHLVQVTIRKNGKPFFGLAGHDGYMFHGLPEDSRVVRVDENRNEIQTIDEETFMVIKQKHLLHDNLFPYSKSFDDLEELE